MRRWGTNIAFVVLLGAGIALAALGALIASGRLVQEPATEAAPTRSAPTTTSREPPPPPLKRVVPRSKPVSTAPSTTVLITIKASRGPCWLDARRGSATGKQLAYQTLQQGKSITLHGPRIWLQLGAAGNVDIAVNGRARPVPSAGTAFVLS